MVRQVQERFLDELPRFYFKGESGNLYLIHKSVSDVFDLMIKDKILVEASKKVIRPIQIWREQLKDSIYTINCRVQLEDIKQVQIYLDDVEDSLILDSGELEEGIDEYSNSIELTTPLIVPTEKYYIRVEDWLGNIYLKGIPENTTTLRDKYDVDPILDKFGSNWGVPRLLFNPPILPEDYRYTYPSYCLDIIEPDYYYEQRLLKFGEDIGTLRLTVIELYKYFMVYPEIMGRWRHLCRMGTGDPNEGFPGDFQNRKFMRSDEWNSAVFDVSLDIDSIPKNIDIPSEVEIAKMIEEVFPLSKKAYFALSSNEIVGNEEFIIHDLLEFDLFTTIDSLIQTEEFNWEDETAIYEYIPGFVYDELLLFLITKVMSTRGQCLFPTNPRFYPSEIPFLGEDGYGFTGDYYNGYLCEDGQEVTKVMIQTSYETPEYGWEEFISLENMTLVGVSFDNIQFYDLDTLSTVGNLILGDGNPNAIYNHYFPANSSFSLIINDDFVEVSSREDTLTSQSLDIGYTNPISNNLRCGNMLYSGYTDGSFINSLDLSTILGVGEELLEAISYTGWDGGWDGEVVEYWLLLTDSRVIVCDSGGVIDDLALSGGLGISYAHRAVSGAYDNYLGIITNTNIINVGFDFTTIESVRTDALPTYENFLFNYGFREGLVIPQSVLTLFSIYPDSIEVISGGGRFIVLYSESISIWTYDWDLEEFVEEMIELTQPDPHHIMFINTFRPA